MKTWWAVAAAVGVTTAAVGSWPPIPLVHAAEGGSVGSATCMVTVHVTTEEGKVDTDIRTQQIPCQPGQYDGGHVWYNPFTGTSTYTNYISEGPEPAVPVLKPRKKASRSSSTTGSASNRSSGSSRSSGQSGSTTSATGPKGNRTPQAPAR